MRRPGKICFIALNLSILTLVCLQAAASPGDTVSAPAAGGPVKIDFLSSYYQQDGDHSAVTGGEGTEALKDFASVIKLHIPLKHTRTLQLDSRLNYFTSASSDNIDPKTVSGASKQDVKVGINAEVAQDIKLWDSDDDRRKRFIYALGASHEAHFASVNAGLAMTGQTSNGRGEWSARTDYIMDVWGPHYEISKLYPSDYYGRNDLENNKRHTLDAVLDLKFFINPSLAAGFSAGAIQQFGLLSTPFHRVYFSDINRIDIERFPGYRLRIPVEVRLNGAVASWMMARTSYRFYWDNFGQVAHSAYLEVPLKPISQLTVYPFYRYHRQDGVRYFAPKGAHVSTEEYYTSDYDLSGLQSHFYGGGFRWTPFLPGRTKLTRRFSFEAVEMRGAHYRRSDGLRSWMISGGLSWAILREEDERKR